MKKMAIMQPYFFPYVGYFSLIKHVDEFMLFDPVQYIRHGWIERNRVLKQNEGWLYIKAPITNISRDLLIKDALVDNTQPWQEKLLAQLQPYKKTAPFYRETVAAVEKGLSEKQVTIVGVNRQTLAAVCDYLGFDYKLSVFSEAGLEIETPAGPDEWALNICKALGDVEEYWNPPGGQSFFDRSKYQAAGIDIKFQSVHLSAYDQKRQPFEAGLSIIDVMMFNSPETIREMLDDYELS